MLQSNSIFLFKPKLHEHLAREELNLYDMVYSIYAEKHPYETAKYYTDLYFQSLNSELARRIKNAKE